MPKLSELIKPLIVDHFKVAEGSEKFSYHQFAIEMVLYQHLDLRFDKEINLDDLITLIDPYRSNVETTVVTLERGIPVDSGAAAAVGAQSFILQKAVELFRRYAEEHQLDDRAGIIKITKGVLQVSHFETAIINALQSYDVDSDSDTDVLNAIIDSDYEGIAETASKLAGQYAAGASFTASAAAPRIMGGFSKGTERIIRKHANILVTGSGVGSGLKLEHYEQAILMALELHGIDPRLDLEETFLGGVISADLDQIHQGARDFAGLSDDVTRTAVLQKPWMTEGNQKFIRRQAENLFDKLAMSSDRRVRPGDFYAYGIEIRDVFFCVEDFEVAIRKVAESQGMNFNHSVDEGLLESLVIGMEDDEIGPQALEHALAATAQRRSAMATVTTHSRKTPAAEEGVAATPAAKVGGLSAFWPPPPKSPTVQNDQSDVFPGP